MTLREAIIEAAQMAVVFEDNAGNVWEADDLLPELQEPDREVVYGPGAIWAANADGYRVGAEPLFTVRGVEHGS